MQQDPAQLWQSALRYLRQHVSEANYQTWLADTEGVRLDGSTLIIGTRSEFVTEWLQQRLRPLMVRTLTDIADRPLEVAFEPLQAPADDTPLLQRSGAAEPAGPVYPRPRLHSRYVFDTFIVGPGNRLAFAAAEGVADSPGTLHNPLFLYGAVGLGKTHLLQGIGHRLVRAGRQITYISAEQFTNDLVTAIQQRTQEEFRARYRSADALLIDDIQFVGGKEATRAGSPGSCGRPTAQPLGSPPRSPSPGWPAASRRLNEPPATSAILADRGLRSHRPSTGQ